MNKEITKNQVMKNPYPTGSPISVNLSSDQRTKITSDIQAAGLTANRLYPAYQYTALSASPEDTYEHTNSETQKT